MRNATSSRFVASAIGWAAAFAIGALGCASAPPPAPAPTPLPTEVPDRGPISMEGEIGGMNEDAVARAFDSMQKPIVRCIEQGAAPVEHLGGRFVLSLRIDREGHARWAYLSQSTLGDRQTERCVLDEAKDRAWPKPVGGEGLASRVFEIDASSEPIAWEESRVRGTLKYAAAPFAKCRAGQGARFVATAYVQPDGRVLAAGVAPPEAAAEDAANCLVDAIEGLRFVSPGRKAAKVTFDVP